MSSLFSPPGDDEGQDRAATGPIVSLSDELPREQSRFDPRRLDDLERAVRRLAAAHGFKVERFTTTEYRGESRWPEVDITLEQIPTPVIQSLQGAQGRQEPA